MAGLLVSCFWGLISCDSAAFLMSIPILVSATNVVGMRCNSD